MDTCMAESLCCAPETITTLLIGYTSIQNKVCQKIVPSSIPPTPQFHFVETIIFNPLVIFSVLYLHVFSHSVVSDSL